LSAPLRTFAAPKRLRLPEHSPAMMDEANTSQRNID
jgi:hypothetical protein